MAWWGLTPSDELLITGFGLLLFANQLRLARKFRRQEADTREQVDVIAKMSAELIICERRDTQKQFQELEAAVYGRLDGSVPSLADRRTVAGI